jgi:hypothetical protein
VRVVGLLENIAFGMVMVMVRNGCVEAWVEATVFALGDYCLSISASRACIIHIGPNNPQPFQDHEQNIYS